MSVQDDLTPIVRSWLQGQAGPLSGEVREWVLERVPATTQRRRRLSGRRFPIVAASRLAAAAAVIVVVAGSVALLARPDHLAGGAGLPSPSTQATLDATPLPVRYSGTPPGRFYISEPNTDGVGTWPAQVYVTVPQGWSRASGLRGSGLSMSVGEGVDPMLATLVFGRPGSLTRGPLSCPDRTDFPVGKTVDEFVSALLAIAGVQITDLTIQGYPGKRVEFTIPDPDPACQGPVGWSTPSGGELWSYSWGPGWHHQLSILDIDGVRFLIDAGYRLDAPPEVRDALQSMVDSVELGAASPDSEASAAAPTP